MSDKHIIGILENTGLAKLTENEMAEIRAHTSFCLECRRALEATRISSLLLKARVAESFEPSPFFQTRVLAVLRERQTANETWVFGRMWRTAGALVSSMAATVVTLAILSFVVPSIQPTVDPQNMASAFNNYSAEEVILNQGEPADEQISDGQVLTTLYGAEEDLVK